MFLFAVIDFDNTDIAWRTYDASEGNTQAAYAVTIDIVADEAFRTLTFQSLIKPVFLPVTARELFKQFGCSERLYREAFEPFLQIGLFAPGEQCSAAATLGMLYYFFLAHQVKFMAIFTGT